MYMIDTQNNKIIQLQERTFRDLKFNERNHLQEWIANEPSVFGEELLIIQKEFSGFADTQERLDLLALDKEGALVIIENKLDDSGKDVTWQALKYASYCSSLKKDDIKNIYQDFLKSTNLNNKAEEKLSEFFDGTDYEELNLNKGITQRIILTAANFRKEVTSTVLWLLNFNVRIQCFRATPHSMGDKLFLNIERVIPTQDAEEYMIGMAKKAQDDIIAQSELSRLQAIRKKFWTRLIEQMNNSESDLYRKISPSKYHYLSAGSGVRGAGWNFAVSNSYPRSELYIYRGKGSEKESEFIFDQLYKSKDKIEKVFGRPLEWQKLEEKHACRISDKKTSNILDEDQWDELLEFLVDSMTKLELSFKGPLNKVNRDLKEIGQEPTTGSSS